MHILKYIMAENSAASETHSMPVGAHVFVERVRNISMEISWNLAEASMQCCLSSALWGVEEA